MMSGQKKNSGVGRQFSCVLPRQEVVLHHLSSTEDKELTYYHEHEQLRKLDINRGPHRHEAGIADDEIPLPPCQDEVPPGIIVVFFFCM